MFDVKIDNLFKFEPTGSLYIYYLQIRFVIFLF